MVARCAVLAAILMLLSGANAQGNDSFGTLRLKVIDADTGKETPARIEVLNETGESFIAEDALPISVSYVATDKDAVLVNETPDVALSRFKRTTQSPYTGNAHFYITGESRLHLPRGAYRVRVFKGPEYHVRTADIKIEVGEEIEKELRLARFANMPAKGWYSSDGHLHLARANRGVDPLILKQMQAEDIHVGNILQIGQSHSFAMTPQYAYGSASLYQEGANLIITGQENLRTHILGHAITLGAQEPLRDNDAYLIYRKFWERAVKQGGINGYAHGGEIGNYNYVPISGPPLLAPHRLMHFIEVLQFNSARYDTWYDMLNLGFRIAPTAGTDYLGTFGFPGDERFYTHVDGPLVYEKWVDAVRKGKTFVTTGPLLEFRVNGKDIGDEIELPTHGSVTVEGAVRYDPDKDITEKKYLESSTAFELFDNPENGYVIGLELVENGNVVRRFARVDNAGIIKFKIKLEVTRSSWLALRTIDITSAETAWPFSYKKPFSHIKKAAIAHTAPIYVSVKDTVPISRQPEAGVAARAWLASLDLLEEKFTGDNIHRLHNLNDPSDGVSEELLLNSRAAIMKEIETAKEFFRAYLK